MYVINSSVSPGTDNKVSLQTIRAWLLGDSTINDAGGNAAGFSAWFEKVTSRGTLDVDGVTTLAGGSSTEPGLVIDNNTEIKGILSKNGRNSILGLSNQWAIEPSGNISTIGDIIVKTPTGSPATKFSISSITGDVKGWSDGTTNTWSILNSGEAKFGNLIAGSTNFSSLTVSGATSLSSTLEVVGNTTLTGTLTANNNVTISGNNTFYVGGTSTLNGLATFNNGISATYLSTSGDFSTVGNIFLNPRPTTYGYVQMSHDEIKMNGRYTHWTKMKADSFQLGVDSEIRAMLTMSSLTCENVYLQNIRLDGDATNRLNLTSSSTYLQHNIDNYLMLQNDKFKLQASDGRGNYNKIESQYSYMRLIGADNAEILIGDRVELRTKEGKIGCSVDTSSCQIGHNGGFTTLYSGTNNIWLNENRMARLERLLQNSPPPAAGTNVTW
jgi:cytoskeletal protein CcmA (bactofilin family)